MAILNSNQQPIIGWRSLVVTQVVNAVDVDAQAFITAAAITDLAQASAINTLVNDLKSAGVWTKMKALYPMIGGTASSHKWNLKDPRDLDAAFRLVFNGGWAHSATGALPNGSTGYMNTNLTPSTSLSQNSTHVSYYSRTNNALGGVDVGSRNATATLTAILNDTDSKIYFRVNRSAGTANSITPITDSRLFYILNRTASAQEILFTNTTKTTFSANSSGLSTFPIFLGALNDLGVAKFFGSKECAFASIGDGLTDVEAANFYTAVQTYQTTLGRHVGTPILADGLTAKLLDTYSGATAAYSLRKIRTDYTGFAIRVRRSNDNASQDIGFKSDGTLDTTSLLSFVGANSGFISIWYDQSGNGYDFLQATSSSQPWIVASGVLYTLNGKPSVYHSELNIAKFLKVSFGSTSTGAMTAVNVGSNQATAGGTYLWSGAASQFYAYSYNTTWMRIGASSEFALTSTTQNLATQRIINAVYNGATSKLRFNNGTYATGNTGTVSITGLTLGASNTNSAPSRCHHQEFIVWNTNKLTDMDNINSNINSYYTTY
jgi:hypothetical protein